MKKKKRKSNKRFKTVATTDEEKKTKEKCCSTTETHRDRIEQDFKKKIRTNEREKEKKRTKRTKSRWMKKQEIPKAKQRNGNSETNARKVLNCDARICVKGFAQLMPNRMHGSVCNELNKVEWNEKMNASASWTKKKPFVHWVHTHTHIQRIETSEAATK